MACHHCGGCTRSLGCDIFDRPPTPTLAGHATLPLKARNGRRLPRIAASAPLTPVGHLADAEMQLQMKWLFLKMRGFCPPCSPWDSGSPQHSASWFPGARCTESRIRCSHPAKKRTTIVSGDQASLHSSSPEQCGFDCKGLRTSALASPTKD